MEPDRAFDKMWIYPFGGWIPGSTQKPTSGSSPAAGTSHAGCGHYPPSGCFKETEKDQEFLSRADCPSHLLGVAESLCIYHVIYLQRLYPRRVLSMVCPKRAVTSVDKASWGGSRWQLGN